MPPSFKFAKSYARNLKLGLDLTREEMSDLNAAAVKLSDKDLPKDLFCSKESLLYFGSGTTIYFDMIKLLALPVIVAFSCSGIYDIYSNYYKGDYCEVTESETASFIALCRGNLIFKTSLANKFT
jgi:hypothetical protein